MTEPATTDQPVKRTRATKKVAAKVDAVESVSMEEAVAPADNVIGIEPKKASSQPNLTQNEDGVLGSRAADRVFVKAEPEEVKVDDNKTAVWSEKNIRWTGVGFLVKGYNIVSKEAAVKWLSRDGIREASPEEVAVHYGK